MAPNTGSMDDIEIEELAKVMAPRERVCVIAVQTAAGWHTYGFQGAQIVWEQGIKISPADIVQSVFVMAEGKIAFQRSAGSSAEAAEKALPMLRKGRFEVQRAVLTR